ncbi:PhzF family phenazine biosynthesis protein [Kitasatospora sp. GP30]|uniref:PhzF family phenazine biosynthesis protein n=1 Tax=Kitasatospora sp. GP30 TaxID=3035084 RepID=UPI000C7099E9|nr:PhzF family phenazine biosynthesis isomerase [Kitasatospora sp. GP30]MDH6140548.1 PhzF family phenazine biosynthesis protein [Kitasatospora sp. GP30]
MIKTLRYAAFTTDPAGGNKAGVVPDADGLTDRQMLGIAAELGYPETAFLTALSEGERRYRVRYFAPAMEVPFCGHATIAAAVAVAERSGPGELVFETNAGTVPVAVAAGPDGVLRATLTSVEPHTAEIAPAELTEALAALRWSADELDPTLPPRVAYAGARHLVLAAGTRERLAELDYDVERLTTFMTAHQLITLQLVWPASATVYHVRDPFPVGGVFEDPATGAAAAAFGAYLRELGRVPEEAELTLHQGEDMGSPGELRVELHAGDPRVRVSGAAVRLPD